MKKLLSIMVATALFISLAACDYMPFSANIAGLAIDTAKPGDIADDGAGASDPIALEDGMSSLRIVIDPGHGGIDSGAVGMDTGVFESELNLEVSRLVANQFINAGADVLMTRETADVDYTGEGDTPKLKDMNNRASLSKELNPHVLVSIHMNMFTDRKVSGAQVFFQQGSSRGEKLAGRIQEKLNASINKGNKRTSQSGDYFMTKAVKGPSVIVECGFLSNRDEEKKLMNAQYRQRLADCIFHGICDYLGVR